MKQSAMPPVYSQVAYDIAAKIASGEIREEERFTGRSLMGSQYGVSAETIRRAMRLLCDMGIIAIRQNVGSVVISRQRAAEYVEQYQTHRDLRAMKAQLRQLLRQREELDGQIYETINQITDLGERFQRSDRLRNYEFPLKKDSAVVGKSIGQLEFRQKTGATIVAVRRGEEILLSPGPQLVLQENDVLVVACDITRIGRVGELIG
ncbi:TrkA C-terminal domain-containing protein [Angelakisella massiliensis]|uniref:TrkA C-terminal domain-containing protein n=1 Tax=Angelakisella massiliensis TaxID=1871018 RepID=UPI0008F85C02|nr:TrkA C-terminal domain-containing protein [Angelakisella massiliensis]